MKNTLASILIAALAFVSAQAADVSVKLSGVHLCCASCVKGVDKALETTGAKAATDKDAGTVTLTAADAATAQKGVNALVAAGYYGTSDNTSVKVMDNSGAKGKKVTSLKVSGVHLCCGKCVSAVDKIVKSVAGTTGHDAKKDAATFTVTGDFSDKDLTSALQKAGLTGKVE